MKPTSPPPKGIAARAPSWQGDRPAATILQSVNAVSRSRTSHQIAPCRTRIPAVASLSCPIAFIAPVVSVASFPLPDQFRLCATEPLTSASRLGYVHCWVCATPTVPFPSISDGICVVKGDLGPAIISIARAVAV